MDSLPYSNSHKFMNMNAMEPVGMNERNVVLRPEYAIRVVCVFGPFRTLLPSGPSLLAKRVQGAVEEVFKI